jgi:predicted DCC family thiol-disulfide oxidoreductase YuxK
MASGRFKLLYDGECPFCRREVALMKRFDRKDNLVLEDISAIGFDPERYGLSLLEVQKELHGITPDGRVVRRIDALREAYRAVGLGWFVAPAGLPGVHWMFDQMYRVFARNRVRWGNLIGGRCESGKCPIRP